VVGAAQPREWAVNAKYPRPLDHIIAAVDCPVLGMFGETDHLISADDVRRFRDCLERHRKSFSIHLYRDAPHGWLNDTMPGRYRRAQNVTPSNGVHRRSNKPDFTDDSIHPRTSLSMGV
jgi:carboxymethylenebutenolidase